MASLTQEARAKKPSIELLRKWIDELTKHFPNPEMGELEATGLRDALKRRFESVGEERLRVAIQKCILENPNYGKRPTLEQIDQRIPQTQKATYDSKCGCMEGWTWADESKAKVRRCHCWRKETA